MYVMLNKYVSNEANCGKKQNIQFDRKTLQTIEGMLKFIAIEQNPPHDFLEGLRLIGLSAQYAD